MNILTELKRRRVFRVAAMYIVVGWVVAQIVDVVNEPLALPDWFDTAVIVLLGVGFPVAMVLAWAYDLTPDGVRKTADIDENKVPPSARAALAGVAVIPFRNLTESSPHGFLAEAIPMELKRLLTRVSQLRVVAGQASGAQGAQQDGLNTLATELGVQYVISGSVAEVSDKIRIMVELDDAMNNTLLWSHSYDTTADDLLDVQREIAESIASAFGGERLRVEINRTRDADATGLVAWELVHKARSYLLDYRVETVEEAIPLLERAIEISPDYAEAHAALGLVRAEAILNGLSDDPVNDRERAVAAVTRAEELAPQDPVVLRAAGPVYAYCGDYARSLELLRRAVTLAPYDLGAWGYLAWPLTATGRPEDRDELSGILDRLLDMAPTHPGCAFWMFHKAVVLAGDDRPKESLKCVDRAIEQQPSFALAWMHRANLLGQLGRDDDARRAAERSTTINPAMTIAHYVGLMSVLSDQPSVVAARTEGLIATGLWDASA